MDARKFIILFTILVSLGMILTGLISYMPMQKVVCIEKYPEMPITIIVSYGAGGTGDLLARSLEKSAMKHLGQPLVIKNMPGGSGMLGWNELARMTADGYTLGLVNPGIILQPLYGSTRYHYMSALEPIAQIVTEPQLIVVRSDTPWRNINDLIAYAKEHPGEIKYGHSGLGDPRHLLGEMLAKEAGIDIVQVPFVEGGGEALIALLGGHVQMTIGSALVLKEQVKAGRVRVLAVADEKRLTDPVYKDVPTLKEQGYGIVLNSWQCIAAPKQIPKELKYKLAAQMEEVINDAEFRGNMERLGMTIDYLGPEGCKQKWVTENEKLSNFVKENGIAEIVANKRY